MRWVEERYHAILLGWFDAVLWRIDPYWQAELVEVEPELFSTDSPS